MKKTATLLITIWFLDMANAQNLPECPPGIVFVDDCTSACLVCSFQNPVNIGAYSLLVTGINGCTSTAQALVEADFNPPSLSATGGELNCHFPAVLIAANASPGAGFLWSGPGNFQSTLQSPAVHLPGIYLVIAISFATLYLPFMGALEVFKGDVTILR